MTRDWLHTYMHAGVHERNFDNVDLVQTVGQFSVNQVGGSY